MSKQENKGQIQRSNPAVSAFLEFLKKSNEEEVKQSFDTWRMFKLEDGFYLDAESLLQFQQYPTAKLYIQALLFFEKGRVILESYKKDKVETVEDCLLLRPAFCDFVYGHISENTLFTKDLSIYASSFVDQYLQLKSDDFMVEYLQFLILYRSSINQSTSELTDYEKNKTIIRSGEKLADKLKSAVRCPDLLPVRIDLYYMLGSRYSATKQKFRALDCFEKSYKLDNDNYRSLYGVAYHYMERDSRKAKSLFQKYLQIAPKCDKQYPNAYYMLASMAIKDQNRREVNKYQMLAENAEKERLPFLEPVNLPQKDTVQLLKKFKV